jgi:hypothetical protein
MVSAKWRTRIEQGTSLVKRVVVVDERQLDNKSTCHIPYHAWQSTLNNNGQDVSDKHGVD